MALDYKRPSRKRGRKGTGNRGWMWLASGLLLGSVIGAGGYLLMQSHGEAKDAPVAIAKAPAATRPGATAGKAAPKETAKPEAPAKPRFEFYSMLPEMEVSDERMREAMNAPAKKADDGPYILQVGSFRRPEEADGMKARLALLGIESSVQKVVIGNADVWYRVRLGPYDSMREMGQARSRLQHNDIESVVLRLGA